MGNKIYKAGDPDWHWVKPRSAAACALIVYTPYECIVAEHKKIFNKLFKK
jgi:hypothetical protein